MSNKNNTSYISYDTYFTINNIIDREMERLENNFHIACNFIPSEQYNPKKLSGIEKAHKIFGEEYSKLKKVKNEFHTAVQLIYKNHPNKNVRKFWGLE